jgi:hypothetical protein
MTPDEEQDLKSAPPPTKRRKTSKQTLHQIAVFSHAKNVNKEINK